MQFGPYENNKNFVPPPKPSLNGGLYTGEPFAKDAPYANVPVVPDAGYMIHYNLRSANPPPDAIYQYPGGERPGNNHQPMPGYSINKKYNIACNNADCKTQDARFDCNCSKCSFSKYAYY